MMPVIVEILIVILLVLLIVILSALAFHMLIDIFDDFKDRIEAYMLERKWKREDKNDA